jgi:hypothetical protein
MSTLAGKFRTNKQRIIALCRERVERPTPDQAGIQSFAHVYSALTALYIGIPHSSA